MNIESAWPLIGLSIVLMTLIVGAIWSVIDMRQSENLAEDWAHYRKSVPDDKLGVVLSTRNLEPEILSARECSPGKVTRQEIRELAAIFQQQHGLAALRLAELRRDQHAAGSDGFELWDAIAVELQLVYVGR